MQPVAETWTWLQDAARERERAGLHRILRPRPPSGELVAGEGLLGSGELLDLASNDYLGLTRHPEVVAAAIKALRAYGAGATGSRLVTGTTRLHEQLEQALAERLGAESALVFSSGYLANLGAVCGLAGPGTLIVSDSGNHASLIDACRLSRARVQVVAHQDPGAVAVALADRAEPRALVVTDAIFSVDGALAPLAELHAVARRHHALLLVDEAHAVGVMGPAGAGAAAAAGLAGQPEVVLTLTLSKSLGSQGGAVVGPALLREHLIDTARAFVFDTGLAPAATGAALAALTLVDDVRLAALRRTTLALARALVQAGVPVTVGAGAVLAVVLGDAAAALAAQQACAAQGVLVGCFRPPSVPAGRSCLRLTTRADLTDADIVRAVAVIGSAVRPSAG